MTIGWDTFKAREFRENRRIKSRTVVLDLNKVTYTCVPWNCRRTERKECLGKVCVLLPWEHYFRADNKGLPQLTFLTPIQNRRYFTLLFRNVLECGRNKRALRWSQCEEIVKCTEIRDFRTTRAVWVTRKFTVGEDSTDDYRLTLRRYMTRLSGRTKKIWNYKTASEMCIYIN